MYRFSITLSFYLSLTTNCVYATEVTEMLSENQCPRSVQADPKYLVLHTVGYEEDWVIQNFTKSSANDGLGVSAHYYIPPAGDKILQFVDPKNTAYHAGISEWRGEAKSKKLSGLNHISIGIEAGCSGAFLVDGQAYYPYSFPAFTDACIDRTILIASQTMKAFGILPQNVVWHSDISPFTVTDGKVTFRKTDPGAAFPAKRLASEGVGVWPVEDRISDMAMPSSLEHLKQALLKIGYAFDPKDDMQSNFAIQAFIMHYAPQEVIWDNFRSQKDGLAWDGSISENIMIRAENLATGNLVEFN